MKLGVLERSDAHVLFFRLACDLGFAMEKHRERIAEALLRADESLYDHLREKSRNWVDSEIRSLAKLDYPKHIQAVRSKITADPQNQDDGELRAIFQNIADDLKETEPAGLAVKLHGMAQEVHEFAGRAIQKYGGEQSARRWPHCGCAVLEFDCSHLTRFSFSRRRLPTREDVITIHIGPQTTALQTFFNLRFYFCHEYLSHSFPMWDDKPNCLFSEGLLMMAAKIIVYKETGDFIRHRFTDDAFASREGSAPTAEAAAEWFHNTIGPPFLRYLFDWAATEDNPDNVMRVKFLSHLPQRALPGGHLWDEITEAFQKSGFDETQAALDSIRRRALPIQPSRIPLR